MLDLSSRGGGGSVGNHGVRSRWSAPLSRRYVTDARAGTHTWHDTISTWLDA